MKKTMQELVNEYSKNYLPNNDKLTNVDIAELIDLATDAVKDSKEPAKALIYELAVYSFQAGFMRGHRTAQSEARKTAKKG